MATDELGVQTEIVSVPRTKRGLLSTIASIYDPLGILAPVLIEGRIIVQDLCRLKVGWDMELDSDTTDRIRVWVNKLSQTRWMSVPRCLKVIEWESATLVQLHLFSDASIMALGVVAYLRVADQWGNVSCRFIMGKARVAPLKNVSVPRLELSAAVLAVKLGTTILAMIDFKVDEVYYWTDSTTVLQYIKNDQARYQTFVANRVSMIRDGSDQNQWRYVNSEWNPADDASRSKQSKRWRTGPDFLLKEECFWPTEPAHMSNSVEGLEVRREIGPKKAQVCKTISSGVGSDHRQMGLHKIIHRYSQWIRLLRAVGWFILFGGYLMYKHRQQLSELNMQLSTQVMSLAENVVVQVAQRIDYEEEITSLHKGNTIRVSSSLRRLKPILRNGLLCVGGRLSLANIAPSERHPIILPYKGHLTDMVIQYYHEHSNHVGIMYVLGLMREKFWVVKGNAVVRRVLGKCIKSRKAHGKVIEQQMADLPPDRVEAGKPPFYRSGVDLFGPFFIKRGRVQIKHWGVIFTCLNMRAIHLEVASNLTSDSFINAFRRFLARRGQVKTIRCDCGTNFVGSRKVLDSSYEFLGDNKV